MNTKQSLFSRGLFFCLICLLALTAVTAQAEKSPYYNVLKYGAKNDGSKKATDAIRKAIDAAVKAGGGTVYFPAGEYLTGPIRLRSNITIFIDAGAVIKFSDNFDDYLPMVPSRYEGIDVTSFHPLFYAYEEENIAIVGRGTIDGQGKKWWAFAEVDSRKSSDSKWQKEFHRLNKDILLPDLPGTIERGFLRPPFIQPMFCKNVLIEGITIINSPFWTVTPEFCENVTITGVTINNPPSPNTDGINPSSCSYVRISDCHISVGDDCITIKSGKDRAGRKMATPAQNYTITNCTMLRGHGGVVIGSEMSGDVKKITISNCVFDGTDRGIRIKTARGRGGVVEEIRVDNVIMKDIKDQAIVLNMQYAKSEPEPVSERTPAFRNIHFSDITAMGVNEAILIDGLEEMPVENITFSNMNINSKTGVTIRNAKRIELHNIQLNNETGTPFKFAEVQGLELSGIKTYTPLANTPLVELTNVEDAFLYNSFPRAGTDIFLKLKGSKTKGITLNGNNLKHVKTPLVIEQDVTEKPVVELKQPQVLNK
ncbi:glycoside hydrolase family 28 protein [Botryobacter ruber]|uniref:glycoside hydrolase family 28 protein n=1 Tax=Botryobacter ruber TaxID=2171629 RepID=UPI000E0B59E8|nr:glycoside hydrolase family 28 protein [Botryobacter ruber]